MESSLDGRMRIQSRRVEDYLTGRPDRSTRLLVPIQVLLGIVLIGIHEAATTPDLRNSTYLATIGLLFPAMLIGYRLHRPAISVVMLATAMGGCFLLTEMLAAAQSPDRNGTTMSVAIETPRICGQLLFIACLVRIVTDRHGRHPWSLVGDAAIVAIGAWLISWVVLIQPAIQQSPTSVAATLVRGLSQPLGVVIVFLLTMVLFAETFRTVAVWLLAATILLTLFGDLGYAAIAAGHAGGSGERFDTFYMGAYIAGGAVFLHPSVRSLNERVPVGPVRGPLGRILLTSLSMLIPAVILAVVSAGSTTDRVVRAISAATMTLAVSLRIREAVRANSAAQKRLLTAAQHDLLTGLPTRQLVDEQITEALHEAWRRQARPTVLFIDVDRFKIINDSLGHAAGDEILRIIGRRLRASLPHHVVLGRISGDEFIALDPTITTVGEAMALADRVLSAFRDPVRLAVSGDMHVSASIGVALAEPGGRASAEELQRNADTAMYRAKESGRNCIAVFDQSMHRSVAHRLSLESAMHGALERRELTLAYQPIVELRTGQIAGFEALMRWTMPNGRSIAPSEFIPIAEETGLIVTIGAWALLEALTQLRTWLDSGSVPPDATMSVNVSPRQLRDPGFMSIVQEALRRSKVPPERLWIEVTEGVMITDPEQTASLFHSLRAVGMHLTIDDFGTGYSSLSLLRRFPLQRIKIDRAFISCVADDASATSLVRTILAMAESLGLEAVAEGVENVAQFHMLRELGCRSAQGYLFSRPLTPASMTIGHVLKGSEPELVRALWP